MTEGLLAQFLCDPRIQRIAFAFDTAFAFTVRVFRYGAGGLQFLPEPILAARIANFRRACITQNPESLLTD
jgi:hypothetical protein